MQLELMETLYAAELTQVTHLGHHYSPIHQIEAVWGYGSGFSLLWQGEICHMLRTLKYHCKPISEQIPFQLLGPGPSSLLPTCMLY